MRAAVLRAVGEPLALEDVDLAPPGPDDVLVTVTATAICQSDLSFIDGHWDTPLPTVMGHETVGRVTDVGSRVDDLAVGAVVAVSLVRSCGSCEACAAGESVRCQGLATRPSPLRLAETTIDQGLAVAGFAEQVLVHRSQVVPVPETLPTDAAVLLGCGVVTGFGAVVNQAQVQPGSVVVVIGCGGVGLNSVQAARVSGAAHVVAVDIDAAKRQMAQDVGATAALDPTEAGDQAEALRRVTGGRLADAVLVTVGSKPATEAAFELLAPGATLVLVGMTATGTRIEFDATTVAALSQKVLGSKMGATTLATDIPRLVALYEAGEIQLDTLVSAHFTLDAINDAVAAARRTDSGRIVVTMAQTPTETSPA